MEIAEMFDERDIMDLNLDKWEDSELCDSSHLLRQVMFIAAEEAYRVSISVQDADRASHHRRLSISFEDVAENAEIIAAADRAVSRHHNKTIHLLEEASAIIRQKHIMIEGYIDRLSNRLSSVAAAEAKSDARF